MVRAISFVLLFLICSTSNAQPTALESMQGLLERYAATLSPKCVDDFTAAVIKLQAGAQLRKIKAGDAHVQTSGNREVFMVYVHRAPYFMVMVYARDGVVVSSQTDE